VVFFGKEFRTKKKRGFFFFVFLGGDFFKRGGGGKPHFFAAGPPGPQVSPLCSFFSREKRDFFCFEIRKKGGGGGRFGGRGCYPRCSGGAKGGGFVGGPIFVFFGWPPSYMISGPGGLKLTFSRVGGAHRFFWPQRNSAQKFSLPGGGAVALRGNTHGLLPEGGGEGGMPTLGFFHAQGKKGGGGWEKNNKFSVPSGGVLANFNPPSLPFQTPRHLFHGSGGPGHFFAWGA